MTKARTHLTPLECGLVKSAFREGHTVHAIAKALCRDHRTVARYLARCRHLRKLPPATPLIGRPSLTHCKRGHEFTPENIITNKSGRHCRTCRNANCKIRYNMDAELRARIIATSAAYRARKKQQMVCEDAS